MVPLPVVNHAGLYAPLLSSKEAAIAHQNPLETDNPRLFSDLIAALSYVLDVQEDPRLYHAWRVAAVATSMAEQVVPAEATDVFFAALLHDVGGMGAFSHIIHYPTLYSQKTHPEVIAHPQRGSEIIKGIPGMDLSAAFVADHHEWWSGAGYPLGKTQDEITIGAQLIRIADSADTGRQFRPDVPPEQIIHTMGLLSNMEVGSDILDAFRQVMCKDNFYRELVEETKLHTLIQGLESSIAAPVFQPNSDALGTVLTVFARVIDAKHGFTSGHSERVSEYATRIAKSMELPHQDAVKIRFAGLLHDAGKVAVPRSIIDKPGPLAPTEFMQVKHHPVLTMDILRNIVHLSELAWIAGHHHERWDGKGYPDGLAGEEIPLLSRILAAADAMDAIMSPRSYKQTKTLSETLDILHESAGSQFDPQVVDAAHTAWNPPS